MRIRYVFVLPPAPYLDLVAVKLRDACEVVVVVLNWFLGSRCGRYVVVLFIWCDDMWQGCSARGLRHCLETGLLVAAAARL